MRIGLMSDTHDRVPAIDALLREMLKREVTFVLHAGDFCSPFSLKPFQDHGIAMAGVFGRNDGDMEGLRATAAQAMGQELFESPHGMKVGDHKVLVVHDIGEVVERSVLAHAVVVHGHTHLQEMKTRNDTLIVNPGEACGWLYGAPSAAILDLQTKHVEFIKLDGAEWKT
ncbi:MAG: metallophosphoesterase [Gemmatimonadaceae bacterium]|nr:metallophosphoesterase [Gemmatimonadaceae bacterium]MCW5825288.1 metallophosphoesterase [Gemmatimonadaceae bacterium]